MCVATLVATVAGAVTQPLGDRDIVDFELAGSAAEAQEILAGWRADDVIGDAKAIQLFDLVYPLVYASALAGCCLAAAGRVAAARAAHGPPRRAWPWRGWRSAAAGFDYVENAGLAVSLWDEPAVAVARAGRRRRLAEVHRDRPGAGVRRLRRGVSIPR